MLAFLQISTTPSYWVARELVDVVLIMKEYNKYQDIKP